MHTVTHTSHTHSGFTLTPIGVLRMFYNAFVLCVRCLCNKVSSSIHIAYAKPHTNRCQGFTLVEVIVVVALTVIMSLAVTTAIYNMYQYNAYTFAQAYQVQYARLGIQNMVRDIREMTFADDGSFPLVKMEPNTIGFYSDIDRDESVEYVEYSLVGTTTLVKTVYNATGSPPTYPADPDETDTLSRYVQNIDQATSTFLYYDSDGVAHASSSDVIDIRYVRAQVIVNIDPLKDPGQYMLRSSASLRNLKDNL